MSPGQPSLAARRQGNAQGPKAASRTQKAHTRVARPGCGPFSQVPRGQGTRRPLQGTTGPPAHLQPASSGRMRHANLQGVEGSASLGEHHLDFPSAYS